MTELWQGSKVCGTFVTFVNEIFQLTNHCLCTICCLNPHPSNSTCNHRSNVVDNQDESATDETHNQKPTNSTSKHKKKLRKKKRVRIHIIPSTSSDYLFDYPKERPKRYRFGFLRGKPKEKKSKSILRCNDKIKSKSDEAGYESDDELNPQSVFNEGFLKAKVPDVKKWYQRCDSEARCSNDNAHNINSFVSLVSDNQPTTQAGFLDFMRYKFISPDEKSKSTPALSGSKDKEKVRANSDSNLANVKTSDAKNKDKGKKNETRKLFRKRSFKLRRNRAKK